MFEKFRNTCISHKCLNSKVTRAQKQSLSKEIRRAEHEYMTPDIHSPNYRARNGPV